MKWSRTFFSSTKSFKLSWRNTSRLHVSFLAFATRATLFPETETMPHWWNNATLKKQCPTKKTTPLWRNSLIQQKQCPTKETVAHYRNSAQIEKQSNLKNFFLSLVKLKDKFKFMHVLSRLQINTTFIINKTVREMTQPPPYHFLCLWLWLQARNNSVTSRPGPQWPGISDISQATVCKRL